MAEDKDTSLRVVTFNTGEEEIDRMRLERKDFKSGSRGYWAGGKLLGPDRKRYQVSVSIVEIGSKPTA
jgi:hypothetical protein